jgi:hypothetical protein
LGKKKVFWRRFKKVAEEKEKRSKKDKKENKNFDGHYFPIDI